MEGLKDEEKMVSLFAGKIGKICTLGMTVPLYLSMIIVGAFNYSECHYSQAATYLILAGSTALCLNLGLINPKLAGPFALLNVVNLFWGSVTVFGKNMFSRVYSPAHYLQVLSQYS